MRGRYISLFFVFSCLLGATTQASVQYKDYKPDYGPLQQDKKKYEKYFELLAQSQREEYDRSLYQKRFEILQAVLKKDPDWVDGYWLAASEVFQHGSSLHDPADHRKALKLFEEGERLSRECLKKDPKQLLCKLFVASNLAGGSAIRGIMPSLRHAAEVHELWQEVANSDINYQFTPEVSLQGSVNYALGLYYRLVPDSRFMDWFFNVRGSLTRSVEYHSKNLEIDGSTPCGNLMLAAAILCAEQKKKSHSAEQSPEELLARGKKYEGFDVNQKVCQDFSFRLAQQPRLACGLTTAKQQTEPK